MAARRGISQGSTVTVCGPLSSCSPGARVLLGGLLLAGAALPACNCDDSLGQLRATIEVQPDSLDFGSVALDSTKELEISVRNKGSFLLTLTGFETAAPFIAPAGTATVGTGRTITRLIGFRPTALGPASGTLTITSDLEGSEPVVLPLSGTGIQAAVKVDPATVDFGEVLWTPATMPERRTVTVSNPGTDTFELLDIELTENGGGQMTLDAGSVVGTYAPGAMQTFEVAFMPTARGPASGAVRIHTNTVAAPEIVVPLTARAVGPVLQLCGNAEGEAEQCVTPTDRPRVRLITTRMGMARGQLRAKNVGDRPLTISAVLVNGPAAEFSFVPAPSTSPIVIPANGDSTWSVTYTPQDYAFDSVIVSFASDSSSGGIESMRVEGDVIRPDLEAVPRGLTFHHTGNIPRGQTRIRLYNCGTAPLRLGAITVRQLTGPVTAFSLENVPAAGTMIAPQPNCSNDPEGAAFDVVFATTTDGSYTGEVSVGSDDPLEPTITITAAGAKD